MFCVVHTIEHFHSLPLTMVKHTNLDHCRYKVQVRKTRQMAMFHFEDVDSVYQL